MFFEYYKWNLSTIACIRGYKYFLFFNFNYAGSHFIEYSFLMEYFDSIFWACNDISMTHVLYEMYKIMTHEQYEKAK